MKDEAKEILDDLLFTTTLPNVSVKLSEEKLNQLKDYITNLQEDLKVSQTNEETYRLEMEDITKILGLDEHTIFDEVKEYATNLQEENEKVHKDFDELSERYFFTKSRNEKAKSLTNRTIEIIKQQPSGNDEWILERLNGINYCLGGDEE